MAKINLQFHATYDEMIAFIKTSSQEYNLFIVASQLFPEFTCELIGIEEFLERENEIKNSRMIFLFTYKPDTSIKDYMKFMKVNKEFLLFELFNHEEGVLKESSIGTIADSVEIVKMWRLVISKFKKNLLKGAWVVGPTNEEPKYYKDHYYTAQAKQLFEDGVKIIPFAGSSEYLLKELL